MSFVLSKHIIPAILSSQDKSLLFAYLSIIAPIGLLHVSLFLLIFEGVLGCYSEISTFGDKQFFRVCVII
jgi:hypothetical protein